MPSYSNPYLTNQEEDLSNSILNEDAQYKGALLDMLNKQNSLNPYELERNRAEAVRQQRALAEYSAETGVSLYEEAQKRVNALIQDPVYKSPDELLEAISKDPVLSQVYPTDASKIALVNSVHSSKAQLDNPANAINGYTIDNSKQHNLFGNTPILSDLWQGAKNLYAQAVYGTKQRQLLDELNNLPLKDLTQINHKQDVATQIQNELDKVTNDLTSPDAATRAQALQRYNYYKNELSKLGLSPKEQEIWNAYGSEYTRIKDDLAIQAARKSDLLGSKYLTDSQTQSIKDEYARNRRYKSMGEQADYTNLSYLQDTLKDKFNQVSKDGLISGLAAASLNTIGEIASSAVPFMIPGGLGFAAKGLALNADYTEHFVSNVENYIKEHGDLPNEKELRFMAGAIASTIADYFGSSLLVSGLSKAGITKDINENLLNSIAKARPLLEAGNVNGAARVAVASMIQAQNKLGTNKGISSSLSNTEKEIDRIIKGPKDVSDKVWDSIKDINQKLEYFSGSGVKSSAIAGTKLAGENVASTLADQWANDKYDINNLIDAGVSGLLGGSLFHSINAPVFVGGKLIKNKLDNEWTGLKNVNIDSTKDWDSLTKIIEEPKNAGIKEDLVENVKKSYDKMESKLDKIVENAYKEAQSKFGDAIVQEADGTFSFNPDAEGAANLSDKVRNSAPKEVAKLNKLVERVDEARDTIHTRQQYLDDTISATVKERYDETVASPDKFDKEEIEKRKEALFEHGKEEDKINSLMESDKITKEHAKHILKPETSTVIPKDDAFRDTLKKYNESTAELYEDIYNTDAAKALESESKKDFDKAIDDLVTANTISADRGKHLKDTFTKSIFDNLNKLKNPEKKDVDKTPYSNFATPTKEAVEKSLGINDKTPTIQDALKGVPEHSLSLDDLRSKYKDNINRSLLGSATVSSNKFNTRDFLRNYLDPSVSENDLNKFLDTEIEPAIKKNLSSYVEMHNKTVGKATYGTEEEAKKAIEKIKKEGEKKIYALEPEKVGDVYILKDIIEDIDKSGLRKAKTLKDAIAWFDANKATYAKVKEGNKSLADILENRVIKKLRNGVSADKEKEALKTLKSALTSAESAVATINEAEETVEETGVTHAYTKARIRKETRDLARRFYEEKQSRAKTESEIAKMNPKDIIADTQWNIVNFYENTLRIDPLNLTNNALQEIAQSVRNLPVTDRPNQKDLDKTIGYINKLKGAKEKTVDIADAVSDLEDLQRVLTYLQSRNLLNNNERATRSVLFGMPYAGAIFPSKAEQQHNMDYRRHLHDALTATFDIETPSIYEITEGVVDNTYKEILNDSAEVESVSDSRSVAHTFRTTAATRMRFKDVLRALINTTVPATGTSGKSAYEFVTEKLTGVNTNLVNALKNNIDKFDSNEPKHINDLIDLFNEMVKSREFQMLFGLMPVTRKASNDTFINLTEAPITIRSLFGTRSQRWFRFNTTNNTITHAGIGDTRSPYNNLVDMDSFFQMHGRLFSTVTRSLNIPNQERDIISYYNKSRHPRPNEYHIANRGLRDDLYNYERNAQLNNPVAASNSVGEALDIVKRILRTQRIDNQDYIYFTRQLNGNINNNITAVINDPNTDDTIRARILSVIAKTFASRIITDNTVNMATDDAQYRRILEPAISLYKYAEVLKDTIIENYNRHEPIEITTANTGSIPEYLTYINQAIIHDPNRMHTLHVALTADNKELTVSQKEKLRNLFDAEGFTQIDLTDTEFDQHVANFLVKFINDNNINNIVTPRNAANGTVEHLVGTGRHTHVEEDLARSQYSEWLRLGRRPSVLISDNFETFYEDVNAGYHNSFGFRRFMNRAIQLANRSVQFSPTVGNVCDEIHASPAVDGKKLYNREIAIAMGAVAAGHLPRIASGQSEEWLSTQISTGAMSQACAATFERLNLVSKNNLGTDLGAEFYGATGIKFEGKGCPATLKVRYQTGAAGRMLNMYMLEGLVEVGYVNKETGAYSTTQTEGSNWISVVRVTDKGKKWSTEINTLNQPKPISTGTSHLVDDLLGYDNNDTNYQERTAWEASQNQLAGDFNASNDIVTITPTPFFMGTSATADNQTYEVMHDRDNDIVRVNVVANGVLDTAGNQITNYVYLNRHATVKKDMTMPSYARLVEIAKQNATGWELDCDALRTELSFFNTPAGELDTLAKFVNYYQNRPEFENLKEYLEIKDLEAGGVFATRKQAKNEAWYNQWFRFYKETQQYQNRGGKVTLYFPLINTINNRVFVDSLGINPREFKAVRHFFTPRVTDANNVVIDKSSVPAGRTDLQQEVLKTIIAAGFKLDTDKATIHELSLATDKILDALEQVYTDNPSDTYTIYNKDTNHIFSLIDKINQKLEAASAIYTSTKGVKKIKLEHNAEVVQTVKELYRSASIGGVPAFRAVARNEQIDSFKIRIEIDGLTNGTGIHIFSSGWAGNTDSYSYGLLAGVGIFPADFSTNSSNIRDFVNAKLATGTPDSYQRLGVNSKAAAFEKFVREAAEGINLGSNLELFNFFKKVKELDTSASINALFDALFDRDTMKYVLMPNSYGAGKKALIKFLSNVMSEQVAKRVYSLANGGKLKEARAIYTELAHLNGGSLIFVDNRGITEEWTGKELSQRDLLEKCVLFENNPIINDHIENAITDPIATAAKNFIEMADEHTKALTDATACVEAFYNDHLATILADYDVDKLTNAHLDEITERLGAALTIGSDSSKLGLLKDAVLNSLQIYNIRISSLLKEGKGVVLNAKNPITKESIASALSPEVNHTKDSDIINRCQSVVRENLGAFLGVHDAVVANYNQMLNGVGTEMNKQFFETTLFSYRTLLDYKQKLVKYANWLENNESARGEHNKNMLMSQLNYAIKQLENVALSQIEGRRALLHNVIGGEPLHINQYAVENFTEYVIDHTMAQNYLDTINKDIQIPLENHSFIGFQRYAINNYVGTAGTELIRKFNDAFKDTKEYLTLDDFNRYINNASNGFNREDVAAVTALINQYQQYQRGQYDSSFIKNIDDAYEQSISTNRTLKESLTFLRDASNQPAGNDRVAIRRAYSDIISVLYNADNMGFTTNKAALHNIITKSLRGLNGKISTNFGTYSTMNNLVASLGNTPVETLEELNTLLRNAGYEFEKDHLNVTGFNDKAETMYFDSDDINLREVLNSFTTASFKTNERVEALMEQYTDPYISQMEQILNKAKEEGTPITQIVFNMDKAIDRIVFSAVNRRINDEPNTSVWNKVRITILPAITNKNDGFVNRSVFFKNALENRLGDKFHLYTVLVNNENKDLISRNFTYFNQLSSSYIRGRSIQDFNKEYAVSYNAKSDVRPTIRKALKKNLDKLSFVALANGKGELDFDGLDSADHVTWTEKHISLGFNRNSRVNDDGNIRKFDAYSEDELNELSISARTNLGTEDGDDNTRVMDAASTNWEKNITEGKRIAVAIDSQGNILNANVYNLIMSTPVWKEAYDTARATLEHRQELFKNGVYTNRDATLIPVDIENVVFRGTKLHFRFIVNRDNSLNKAEAKKYIINTGKASNVGRMNLTISPDAPKWMLDMFSASPSKIADMALNYRGEVFKFLYDIYTDNSTDLSKKYVTIPDSLTNKNNYVSNSLDTEKPRQLALYNCIANVDTDRGTIYLGTEANKNKHFGYTTDNSVIVDFSDVPSTDENHRGILEKVVTRFDSLVTRRHDRYAKMHGYGTNTKSEDDMTDAEYALFRDLSCQDITDIEQNLDALDSAKGIDNSQVKQIIDKIKHSNSIIRYRLNKSMGRDGSAVMRRINGVKVGFVQHGISTKGTGSNLEVFAHELTHIPLEFLSMDTSANKQALQLYQFAAKNMTIDHFDTQDKEDKRIFNYLFRNEDTVEPHIEFLDYALTNTRFRNALRNLMKDKNLHEEFDKKINSVFNRLLDTFNNNKKNPNIIGAVDRIFKKSLDLMHHYYAKYPKVPEEAYKEQSSILGSLNDKLMQGITKLTSNVSTETSALLNLSHDTLNGSARNKDNEVVNATEALPGFTDFIDSTLNDVKEGLGDVLKQSFDGVSQDNWAYVKMRMAAKEMVDKAREKGAAALNKVINTLTKDISTKTMNNMPEYVLKADLQCLTNGRDFKDVLKLITSKEARYKEINKLERELMQSDKGYYFINSAKGLANKLIYGVNTSGIGYNNAYEIANFCGTRVETTDSQYVDTIDSLVTLYTMHELNKRNPDVYKELTNKENQDILSTLLKYHQNLITLEKGSVYGDSLQKYHIPKGELHGGKSHNRYEVIPESQLKAYEWVGYKKVKDVKLDPLYKSLLKEKYVAVQAKHMPDVPYQDGITILTDIFKGRNQSTGYIGGKQVQEENFDVFFDDEGRDKVVRYINKKVKDLNNPNFTQLDPKAIDGVFTPSFGLGAKITGCDFKLNEKDTEDKLGRNIKFTSALGDQYGSIIERTKTPVWNEKVAEVLDAIYKERRNEFKFTWIKEDETDKDRIELYKLIPFEIKKYFEDKYPGKGIPIEERYITGILGYRHISASEVDPEYNDMKASFKETVNHLLHSAPFAYGESLAKWLSSIGKENIVIKGITCSLNNITSNCVTLGLQGLKPKDAFAYQAEGLKHLNQYIDLSNQLELIQSRYILNGETPQDAARLRAIRDALKKSPLAYLEEHGAIPQIAEDLTESDRFTKDAIDKYAPRWLQNPLHQATADQKSWAYKKLSQLATFGDITGKYALFKHLTENKGVNKEEAMRQAVQCFIDYSNPLPRELQYLDSIGMLPFTKFLVGNQTNVINTLVKNPVGALSWIMANSWMNISDIYGSILGLDSVTNKLHVPGFGLWYQSLASLPIVRATKFGMDIL